MIAALPMYDFPDCREANDRYWHLICGQLRRRGIAAPDTLTRGFEDYLDHWLRADLVLSQTCGYPYRAKLHGRVTLIGTPDVGLDGCPPGHYRSVFVARADDPRTDIAAFKDGRFAYNDAFSQSGWAGPQNHMASLGLQFRLTMATGAHWQSARAVLAGQADIAGIDAHSFRLMLRNDPDMAGLKRLGYTSPTPGTPYIAALGADRGAIFAAVQAAIEDLSATDRGALCITGLVDIAPEAYLGVPTPAPPVQIAHRI